MRPRNLINGIQILRPSDLTTLILGRLFTALVALIGVALLATSRSSFAQDQVIDWGAQVGNSAWHQEQFVEVAASRFHTVARHSDGSVVAWGNNSYGQCIGGSVEGCGNVNRAV